MSDRNKEDNADAYARFVQEGDAHYRGLRLKEALAVYQSAADVRPDGYEAQLGVARTLTRMRRQDDAFAAAETLVAMDPDRWEGHASLGTLYFLSDQYDEALSSLQRATELGPEEPEPLFTLAQVYADLERHGEAQRALEEGRKHLSQLRGEVAGPMEAFGLHAEIYVCLAAGREAEATELAQRLVRMRDVNPHAAALAYSNLGVLAANSRNLDQAVEYLEEAYSISPYLHLAGRTLGTILVVRRDFERAVAVLGSVVENMPSPDGSTRYVYGVALANSKRRREAEAQFRMALQSGLRGMNRLVAWWQMVWQSIWGRYFVIAVTLAAVVVWLVFGHPQPQTLAAVVLVILFLGLQRFLQRRRR